ncbi:MAG: mechanosensitive ion channel [Anaerolineaceae bacterium]|nr:mechanosensitive ion channel [Anaerolineaceae bacterium]
MVRCCCLSPPSALTAKDESAAIQRIYSNLTTDEELIMEIDPESFEILSSSGPRLMRSKILDLDVDSQNIHENQLDIFSHDNVLYYGISRTIRERIWYYAEEISGIVISAIIYSAVTSLIFIVFCMLTGRYVMSGYTTEKYEAYVSANRMAVASLEAETAANNENEERPSYKAELLRQWQQLSPEGKTMNFFQVSCGIIVLILLAMGFLSRYAALSFYVTGSWQRGINPLSITAIVVIICLARLLLIVMDFIFTMVTLEMSAKEKTVAQLIRSILRSVVMIGLFYNCLSYLGVNTSTLLASVGILSLALSLGAKDLVSDTLAGLGIVFEGAFQTGEIVEIGGFKGFVEEIGIRTTRIRGLGTNNIKIINNSEIHNVINYSRELSKFKVFVDLPVFLPLDMVTEYLERELPVIRKELPMIVTGPTFGGITELDRDRMKILIFGQCLEKDQFQVSVNMNRKIKERIDRLLDFQSK